MNRFEPELRLDGRRKALAGTRKHNQAPSLRQTEKSVDDVQVALGQLRQGRPQDKPQPPAWQRSIDGGRRAIANEGRQRRAHDGHDLKRPIAIAAQDHRP